MAYDNAVDSQKLAADLKTVGDAIRTRSGTSVSLEFPGGMAAAVAELPSTVLPPDRIPDYVRREALAVAAKVKAFQTPNTITFLAISDSHYMDEQNLAETGVVNTANLHMAQAAKIIAYSVPLDFAAHMGDFAFAAVTTTRQTAIRQIEQFNALLSDSYPYFPQLRTVGNHDTGEYRYRQTGDLGDLTGIPELRRLICDYNQGAVYGNADYGYCYRDFPEKRMRVICVNTCEMETTEGENAAPTMSQAQLQWLARTMVETGGKTGWSWMLMGHYPADFGWTMQMGHILHAYIDGASVSVGGETFHFAGHNAAKFIAHFHGHLHNYRTAKIRDTADGTPSTANTEFDAKEICIPNSLPIANNGRKAPFYGIIYAEDITCDKTQDSGEDTAFTVNVIDPDKQVIHSVHYGAGYDRTIGYADAVYRNIRTVLTNAALSNAATSVEDGQPFESTIVLAEEYVLDSVMVTMGNSEITAQAVSGNIIRIPSVTADVTITVTAVKPAGYTNLVPTSIGADGQIYNGTGYRHDARLDAAGNEESGFTHMTCTGFMPVGGKTPYVIRVGGTASKTYAKYAQAICFYDSGFKKLAYFPMTKLGSSSLWGEILAESDPNQSFAWKVTPETTAPGAIKDAKYFRVCIDTESRGSGLVVTIDEPID